ncbi:ester cyclase [Novosphingobium mangrovi (ex Huang et al. 2023)]|uniref:Ester cyclase n=1 Tax=Novosphingobium mangrovi (ex Huang et al. 2023) TaxID=2976432 RepID=A0ABT2I9E2_9SPHN|nr:ester cyclase [Novosphingobium mangrovi (ex Huang et al. 2023)]MCT2401127.1 ester cyclase [Novosphingobium mangrovi (ex Huang et al. 2023)]
MTTRQKLLADFIERVWNRGESAAVPEFLAPLYTIRHDPGDPWEGRTLDQAGFVERLETSRTPFPDQRFAIVHMSESGDSVIIAWTWAATHHAAIAGFPASGQPIAMSGASVYSFDEDDRLTGHWQVSDRLGVFQQLQANAAAPASV